MEKKPKLSIIGLGKLGSPMVAAYASKGYEVIGLDINAEFVRLMQEGKAPVKEPKLAELLAENKERISATQDYKKAVLDSDITFIIVPTPSQPDGDFSTKYAMEAGREIGKVLRKKPAYHLVVLTSTVTPGSTQRDLVSVLEESSGKKCKSDFDVCYNPEFIALGNVIRGLLFPDFVLIGESSKKGGDVLENFYKNICRENPPVKRMSIVNAEITKIALNAYVTAKISYANMLAELCEKIPGGNVDVVTDALGCDTRIGSKYLKGGLGYGGPCFPRDGRAIRKSAQSFGVSLPIAQATDQVNQKQVPRMIDLILSLNPEGKKTGILGLAYKIDTDVVEESQAVEIAKALAEKELSVIVFDPLAMENAKKVLGDRVEYAVSLKDCLERADILILATFWPEFKEIKADDLREGGVLIDCWRELGSPEIKKKVKYIPLGVNQGSGQ